MLLILLKVFNQSTDKAVLFSINGSKNVKLSSMRSYVVISVYGDLDACYMS